MMNVRIDRAIWLILIISVGLYLSIPLLSFLGCKAEAVETKEIYVDQNATWMFEGTFCSDCNKLYNYIEHPKVCDICGKKTKDFFYLVLIKER